MQVLDINQAIDKLSFASAEEHHDFSREVNALTQDEETTFLLRKNTLTPLKNLFLILRAEFSDFELSLMQLETKGKPPSLLKNFFKKLGGLPQDAAAIETLIRLRLRGVDIDLLKQTLDYKILDFYPFEYLQKLKYFYRDNSEVIINFYKKYAPTLSETHKLLALDLLHLLYPTSLSEDSVDEIHEFLVDIVPHFEQRFAHRMTEEQVRQHPERLTEWFMVWQRHQKKQENELSPDAEYYTLDFPTIVKYVPEFIWWNNGLYYRNGDKNFHFGSLGFFHLAQGGSIRKAPDNHQYTRRMAKVFVSLPYDFDQTDKDMYVYCYGKSLGAGTLLLDMLQRFFRHHEEAEELQEELDKWNPVIQKLACAEFEALPVQQALNLTGYIYHCLRDQPDFSVQRRSVANLCQDSDAYYARIQQRARDRARREAAKVIQQNKNEWKPHRSIRAYAEGDYNISELTNKRALEHEGSVMNHCVGSYTQRCKAGHCSIWSLREWQNGSWYSRVTIEVDKSKYIRQASARFNARPNKEHWTIIKSWAKRNNIHTNY